MKRRRIIITLFVGCLLTAVTSFGKAVDKAFKRDRYLVLDSRVIESTENAELTVGVVQKDKDNPLFGEDKPWEMRFDNLYPCVIYDSQDEIYKCWYNPFIVDKSAKGMTWQERESTKYAHPGPTREMCVCYATSKDGIHWEKPELGLIEHGGNRKNNIVFIGPRGPGIFKDLETTDEAKRYKMMMLA